MGGRVARTRSIAIHFKDRVGKGLRRFLRQIVPDAARDHPVGILARELLGIRTGVRVRCPIGIPFRGEGGHGDDRPVGQPLFQGIVLRLAFGQPKAPAIVMHHDADMIRIGEGHRGPLERGLIEGPLRGELPDALGKCTPVLRVARPSMPRRLGGSTPICIKLSRLDHLPWLALCTTLPGKGIVNLLKIAPRRLSLEEI
jgi:hypothetical protein